MQRLNSLSNVIALKQIRQFRKLTFIKVQLQKFTADPFPSKAQDPLSLIFPLALTFSGKIK